jgi:hypothetical protein
MNEQERFLAESIARLEAMHEAARVRAVKRLVTDPDSLSAYDRSLLQFPDPPAAADGPAHKGVSTRELVVKALRPQRAPHRTSARRWRRS